jgi:hypothetical protein
MALVFCIFGSSPSSAQKWHFGLGTGLVRMNVEGDQGLNVALGNTGPVQFAVDLSPDDFQDLMQSAIGGGGYATDGKWMKFSLLLPNSSWEAIHRLRCRMGRG